MLPDVMILVQIIILKKESQTLIKKTLVLYFPPRRELRLTPGMGMWMGGEKTNHKHHTETIRTNIVHASGHFQII